MISYTILYKDEDKEIKRLVKFLLENLGKKDEIIVVCDDYLSDDTPPLYSNINETMGYLYEWGVLLTGRISVRTEYHLLNNDFSQQKNFAASLAQNEWIFNIDADEMISETFIKNIHKVLDMNKEIDMFYLPRINTVDGLTPHHIQKWGWKVNEKGWVNFPDYQTRIYKNNKDIMWENKVHERLKGFKTYTYLPMTEEWCIIHEKNIEKQEKQNNFYNTI